MRKVFLSAGHSNVPGQDRGAVGTYNGTRIEGNEAVLLRDAIAQELKLLGVNVTCDPNDSLTANTIRLFKKLIASPLDICIDIHFNAGHPAATGTECLVPAKPSTFEVNLAQEIADDCARVLGIRKRGNNGVKTELESHHGKLGWMTLSAETVLLEICFITSPLDMAAYDKGFKTLAQHIAGTIAEYSKK